MKNKLAAFLLCGMAHTCFALESTKPPHSITTPEIALRVLKKIITNSHLKITGSCAWVTKDVPPKVITTPALTQFLPDLIVTVSNNPGENPWLEANALYENKAVLSGCQKAFEAAMGLPLGFGDGSSQSSTQHLNEDRMRVVHVIGSPANIYKLPDITHKPETTFGALYYSSLADAINDRTQAGEILYMATHPHLLINHEIGSLLHSWGPEIPRLMHVTQPSRFRASVVAAMHAADIVTNNGMHVKRPTQNKCGDNCVVSNVVFDPKEDKVIWQEVYPLNRNIKPGDKNDFGEKDDKKGNGNYVFVVWRKYQGCVKQEGKLLGGFPNVGQPKKR